MEHISVFLIDLPPLVRGFTVINNDDSYSIFINARLSHEMQHAAYDHEIAHIDNHDFDKIYKVDELELLRHTG